MRGEPPQMCHKIHKYTSSLHKLIRKLHLFITNKNVRKNKNCNCIFKESKIGGQLGLLPRPFVLSKSLDQNYEKAI